MITSLTDGCMGTETLTSAKLVWLIQQQVDFSGCGFRKVISLKVLM